MPKPISKKSTTLMLIYQQIYIDFFAITSKILVQASFFALWFLKIQILDTIWAYNICHPVQRWSSIYTMNVGIHNHLSTVLQSKTRHPCSLRPFPKTATYLYGPLSCQCILYMEHSYIQFIYVVQTHNHIAPVGFIIRIVKDIFSP